MKIFREYEENKKEIFKYFGYVEDWVILPLEFSLDYFWVIERGEEYGGSVRFAKTKDAALDNNWHEEYYVNMIYTKNFHKFVYREKDYTMIVVETQVNGHQGLQIFDNSMEVTLK